LSRIGQAKSATKSLQEIAKEISENVNAIWDNNNKMIEERKKANNLTHADKRAKAYCDKVKPYFEKIRESADKLEELIDNDSWKLPKYRDLLFFK
jgi:glutamine synthetase